MNIRPLLAPLLLVAWIFAVDCLFHTCWSVVVSPSALVLTVGGTTLFLLANYPVRSIRLSFSVARLHTRDASPEEVASAAQCFRSLRRASRALGAIGSLMYAIVALLHLDDPKFIGPAGATTLLYLVYGLILAEWVIQPLAVQCQRRQQ